MGRGRADVSSPVSGLTNPLTGDLDASANQILDVGAIEHDVNTVATSGATESLDATVGVHDVTMDQDCTFSFSNAAPSGDLTKMTVILRGAFTPTWPGAVTWLDGVTPTHQNPTIYEFLTVDNGTTWYGRVLGRAYPLIGQNATTAGQSLDGTETTIATVNLTIPSEWGQGWSFIAMGCATFFSSGASQNRSVTYKINRGGSYSRELDFTATTMPSTIMASINAADTGITDTGSQSFTLTAQLGTNDSYQAQHRMLWVMATRD